MGSMIHDAAFTQVVISVASTLSAAGILWLAGSTRRAVKRLGKEHRWLMETTEQHSREIERNSKEILRIVELLDRRTRR
jgi:hypothetical protein